MEGGDGAEWRVVSGCLAQRLLCGFEERTSSIFLPISSGNHSARCRRRRRASSGKMRPSADDHADD
jgi:hypothetical protein